VEPIGSTTVAQNQVIRELAGASGSLATGDSVYLNEIVKTGADSLAKFVFVDSTNLAVGPTSRVVLDRFVFEGDPSAQKVAVNLAKGVFRFTTGGLDKKAYTINTPTAAIGVRGTILDIGVRTVETRVTLVEGLALVCPRRRGVTLEQQARACAAHNGRCDCEIINHPGETAVVKRVGRTNQASLSSTPVNFASLCAGDSALCSSDTYAYAGFGGSGALCGR
ncbi:MAG TPA: FecR domain-containing protein, partial [Roseiarcus sp.]|nr:FecR domain-containing protein [Roseiarcus sp.]